MKELSIRIGPFGLFFRFKSSGVRHSARVMVTMRGKNVRAWRRRLMRKYGKKS